MLLYAVQQLRSRSNIGNMRTMRVCFVLVLLPPWSSSFYLYFRNVCWMRWKRFLFVLYCGVLTQNARRRVHLQSAQHNTSLLNIWNIVDCTETHRRKWYIDAVHHPNLWTRPEDSREASDIEFRKVFCMFREGVYLWVLLIYCTIMRGPGVSKAHTCHVSRGVPRNGSLIVRVVSFRPKLDALQQHNPATPPKNKVRTNVPSY